MADEQSMILLQGQDFNNIKKMIFHTNIIGADVSNEYSGSRYILWGEDKYFSPYAIHNAKEVVLIVKEVGRGAVYALGSVSCGNEKEISMSFGMHGKPLIWNNLSNIFSDNNIDILIKNKVIWSLNLFEA